MATAGAKPKRRLRIIRDEISRIDDESQQLITQKSKTRSAANVSRKQHVRARKAALSTHQPHIPLQGQSNQHLDPTFDQHITSDLQFVPPDSSSPRCAKKKKGHFKVFRVLHKLVPSPKEKKTFEKRPSHWLDVALQAARGVPGRSLRPSTGLQNAQKC